MLKRAGKLSKTSWMLLASGVFIIAFASMGMAYLNQSGQQTQLNQELSQAQLIIKKSSTSELVPRKEELESRLAQAKSRLKEIKSNLSHTEENIEACDSLFDIAETCEVEITSISSSPPLNNARLNEATYSTLQLTVKLNGDIPDLINFILNWTQEHPTGVVESVRMGIPSTDSEGDEEIDEEEEEAKQPSANIKLVIYTLSE